MSELFLNPFIWLVASVAIAILELLAPGFVFLGLGIGAAIIGLLLFPFGEGLHQTSLGIPGLLAAYGMFSVGAWWGLRKILGVRASQEKIISEDINEID